MSTHTLFSSLSVFTRNICSCSNLLPLRVCSSSANRERLYSAQLSGLHRARSSYASFYSTTLSLSLSLSLSFSLSLSEHRFIHLAPVHSSASGRTSSRGSDGEAKLRSHRRATSLRDLVQRRRSPGAERGQVRGLDGHGRAESVCSGAGRRWTVLLCGHQCSGQRSEPLCLPRTCW